MYIHRNQEQTCNKNVFQHPAASRFSTNGRWSTRPVTVDTNLLAMTQLRSINSPSKYESRAATFILKSMTVSLSAASLPGLASEPHPQHYQLCFQKVQATDSNPGIQVDKLPQPQRCDRRPTCFTLGLALSIVTVDYLSHKPSSNRNSFLHDIYKPICPLCPPTDNPT